MLCRRLSNFFCSENNGSNCHLADGCDATGGCRLNHLGVCVSASNEFKMATHSACEKCMSNVYTEGIAANGKMNM